MPPPFSWDLFHRLPIVGILRGFNLEHVKQLGGACLRGGITNLEVTLNTPGAPDLIRALRDLTGNAMNVGAGTVCSLADLDAALDAGAGFIVTPVVDAEVITAARERGVPVIPGAMTPTEMVTAWRLGANLVKVFPAAHLGPGYIRDVKAALSHIKLMPTGGVTLETLAAFRAAGAEAYGIGSPLFNVDRVRNADWDWVERQARAFAAAWKTP